MKKSFLFLLITLFFTSSYGQLYKVPLEKLNKYFETFDGGSQGHIEVKEGCFYQYYKAGGYAKAKMKDLMVYTSANPNSASIVCRTSDKCIYDNNTNSFISRMEILSEHEKTFIVELLNIFIRNYNYALVNTPVSGNFTGVLKDGKKSGFGQFYIENEMILEGNFENDELVGKGKIFYVNGDLYEGEIKENKANGKGVIYYLDRGIEERGGNYKGFFADGLPNGKGESNIYSRLYVDINHQDYYSLYTTYEGDWKNGLENGLGNYKQLKGSGKSKTTHTYKGNWKNGLKEGYGVFVREGYDNYTGNWKNDMRDGKGIYTETYAKSKGKYDGEWSKDNRVKGKNYNYQGVLTFGGTEEVRLSEEKGRKDMDSRYKEVIDAANQNEKETKSQSTTACVCSKCNGTGKFRVKTIEVYYPDVVNSNGQVVGRSNYSKTIDKYEDMTCGRCLGTGKCN